MIRAALGLLALGTVEPDRSVDFELSAATSLPERFSLCVAAHPAGVLELDLCTGGDRGLVVLSSHLFARKPWSLEPGPFPGHGFTVALGAGAGARLSRFCLGLACAVGGGPELLVSIEGIWWLTATLGLTLQLDGGLAILWAEQVPGVVDHTYRFPLRLLIGVAL